MGELESQISEELSAILSYQLEFQAMSLLSVNVTYRRSQL